MSVELVDSGTIIGFIEDQDAFDGWTNDWFARMDTNHDGLVSYPEMMKELQDLRVLETTHFGSNVNVEEFKEEMKGMMMAIAQNIGSIPVQMILEHDSFLKKAVDRESIIN